MRQGSNPLRNSVAADFEKTVLCVVTHLPNLKDYHAGRLKVVQTCLTTMRAGAHMRHTFIVWDNGSGRELLDWMENDFKPDVLVRSINIGKTSARTAMFRMCHPESIVAYSDDDILYYDNWLRPQMDLLEHFPNVAAVSGYPVRTSFRWGNEHTKAWAQKAGKLEYGRFLPDEWEDDFAISLGRDPEWHREYTARDMDCRVTYQGKQAYCTSHHCQFIGKAETVGRVLQFDGRAMGDERPFDIELDKIGLRLATTERLARHIGNVLDDKIKTELSVFA